MVRVIRFPAVILLLLTSVAVYGAILVGQQTRKPVLAYSEKAIYLHDLHSGLTAQWAVGPGEYLTWSPDGNLLAFIQEGGMNIVQANGTPLAYYEAGQRYMLPRWIGSALFFVDNTDPQRQIYRVEPQSGQLSAVTYDSPGVQTYLDNLYTDTAESPDGRYRIEVERVDGGWRVTINGTILTGLPGEVIPAWTTNGEYVALTDPSGLLPIIVIDTERGTIRHIAAGSSPVWRP